MQTACRLESTTVCCPKRRKDGRAKAGRLHRRTHYGAGELHALQRDGMEDGAAGRVAVACDCGMEERASRVMERARIPKRYEHCDFESYVTDLTDGKTWTPQHAHSLSEARRLTLGFVGGHPGFSKIGLLFLGRSGAG